MSYWTKFKFVLFNFFRILEETRTTVHRHHSRDMKLRNGKVLESVLIGLKKWQFLEWFLFCACHYHCTWLLYSVSVDKSITMLNCTDLECILHHHHYYAHLHHLKHGTHVDEGKSCFSYRKWKFVLHNQRFQRCIYFIIFTSDVEFWIILF